MLKKVISILLVIVFTASLTTVSPLRTDAAMVTSSAVLTGVTYKYNDNVKFKDLSGITRVDGNIIIPDGTFSAGDIIVDRENQTSLKVLKVNPDGTLVAAQPTMIELFKEFDIPRQVIEPTAANITEYAVKGISMDEYSAKVMQQSGENGGQQLMSGNMSPVIDQIDEIFKQRGTRVYEYNGVYEFTGFGGNIFNPKKVKLALDGSLGVSPGIVADYSLSDGYEFGFVDAAQFIKLNMMFDGSVDEEVYLPVFAVTVGIEGLGSVKLGVFLVVDVDGNITLNVNIQEGIIANAYVHGGTSWGVPTSFNVTKDLKQYVGAECDPMGNITAGLYITPMVSLEILDVDVFGAQLRLGFLGHASITAETMSYGVDFVVHAFVTILDDKTNLLRTSIPIIERSKSMREQDDVIFYTSRLCAFQDRINVAAMTKRLAGSTQVNTPPFSDKLPFANRDLLIWYYKAGNDPQGGTNPNPTYKIPIKTDGNGCIAIDFKALGGPGYENGIDVKKGDIIKITAPGFIGQTDLIKSQSPFGPGKEAGQGDFYGNSALKGDFFEDKVEFTTLSGRDLTAFDVPNSDISFETKGRIYYTGPVKIFSTDINTKVTEKAWFNAEAGKTEYTPLKSGIYVNSGPFASSSYNIKPKNQLRWQINADGFIYGAYEETGVGGTETFHRISAKRTLEDKQVVIEDYYGNMIGIQHNIVLHVVAVNKGGFKPYNTTAKLNYALGKVPSDHVQTFEADKCLLETPYIKFPAANVRYPNHYEYYVNPSFPVLLYEGNVSSLAINEANNSNMAQSSTEAGTVTSGTYLWRWEEIKPDIPKTVTIKQTYQDPTGAPRTIYTQVPNIFYRAPANTDTSEFSGVPTAYTEYTTLAGKSLVPPELRDEAFLEEGLDIYQMRHIVSGLEVEGVPIQDPSFSPPQPIEKGDYYDDMFPDDAQARDIEFQFQIMRDYRQFIVSPLDEFGTEFNTAPAAVMKNTSVKPAVTIKNFVLVPQWAKGYVSAVVNNKIMRLDSQGNFPVSKFTTRAEFCTAIVNALGLTVTDTIRTGFPFADVSKTDKDFQQMQIAYQCGIINGSGKSFAPTAQITRQDAAAMLIRAFRLKNESLIPLNTAGSLNVFSDRARVSGYAVASMEQAVAMSFFSGNGKGSLLPYDNITNVQTAKIIWELKLKALNT